MSNLRSASVTQSVRRLRSAGLAMGVCLAAVAIVAAGASMASPRSTPLHRVRRAHYAMGTIFEIDAYGADPAKTAAALEQAFADIRHADEIMSHYREESNLSRLNRDGARQFVPLHLDLYSLLRIAQHFTLETGGAFDVTTNSLGLRWKEAAGRGQPLGEEERKAALRSVGMTHLVFQDATHSVRYRRNGVRIDLGGIAKGWAVDQAAAILRRNGIQSALITAGTSTLYGLGAPPGESAWNIGIRHPGREDQLLAIVSLRDNSLSSSASYENYTEIQGKRYSHILNPRSGLPADSMLSTTVVAPTATESDALSTAVYVLGMNAGARLLQTRRLCGVLAAPARRRGDPQVLVVHSENPRLAASCLTIRVSPPFPPRPMSEVPAT